MQNWWLSCCIADPLTSVSKEGEIVEVFSASQAPSAAPTLLGRQAAVSRGACAAAGLEKRPPHDLSDNTLGSLETCSSTPGAASEEGDEARVAPDPSTSPPRPSKRASFSEEVEEIANNEDSASSEDDHEARDEEDFPAPVSSLSSAHSSAMVWSRSRNMLRRMSRRHSTLRAASKGMPEAILPASAKPLYASLLPDVTVEDVRGALMNAGSCPLLRFLEEVMGCDSIMATEWRSCQEVAGASVRKAIWSAPLPPDVSDTIAKLLKMPPTVGGTTMWRLQENDGVLVLVQHSYTKDVLYGDRFRLQTTLRFSPAEGGVLFENFADTIWVSPLPWTMGCVKAFVERKARADSAGVAPQVKKMIEEAIPRQ